jgi:ribonuclease Z
LTGFFYRYTLPRPELFILGCGSATPTVYRNPSAQLLRLESTDVLIDCGEGTQMQLLKYKLKSSRIHSIFISHLHGDHYLGLPGLLSSMHLLGRKQALHLYGPKELFEVLDLQFRVSETDLRFELVQHPIECFEKQKIAELEGFNIYTFPLNHRIPCFGFQFVEQPKHGSLKMEMVANYRIPVSELKAIKAGGDYRTPDGTLIPNSLLLKPAPLPVSYAYCSDTAYDISVVEAVRHSTWLYHEATFLHALKDRAVETFHSTAVEAAQVAKEAAVQELIIGHFSSRYRETEDLEAEARSVFKPSRAAFDGLQVLLEA